MIEQVAQSLVHAFGQAQQVLFEGLVQPLMFRAGMANWLEQGYAATGWLLVGLLQLAVMVLVIGQLERHWPAEAIVDRRAVRTDVIYTLVHQLGLFRVALFFTVEPLWDELVGQLRLAGMQPWALDGLWPGVSDKAWVSFLLYLLLFDFVDYWYHRGSHRFSAWWQLHAVHHSQRQMTQWTDARNHLLDDVLRDSVFVLVALAVGVPPGQFVAVVAASRLLEALSHANTRLDFGPVLGRLLVGPRFHRVHHGMGLPLGPAAPPGMASGRNYAVLFPVWDVLFGTADFKTPIEATGIRDQLEGRNYGHGFWAQQGLAVARWAGKA